ncbi:protein PLASTID MOVEMENT IMPAIRED 2-like [Silene latifolia]|uniref:protein PLASTID MOVEMENT IMPAIRED 2-like n=1 Tax=Silene latifolia TaxID=37657 RepID=UPI003D76B544
MADKELKGGSELGSVKAAINRYGGKVYRGPGLRIDPQTDAPVSEEASSKAQELHIAKKTVDKINENRRSAETVTSQAEIELLTAKKIVRELTSQIEDLKAKAKQKIHEHELQTIDVLENRQYNDVLQELENVKWEVSKMKLDMARELEDKSRAEKEVNAARLRLGSYMNTAEKLRKEIEEVNEEEVLVELAQIQARKELAAIEAQRKEEFEKHSSKVDEAKKKINVLIKEVEHKKRLEEVLAITNSEADVLQNELNLIKEMDERIALSKNSELQSVTKELEAARKEHALIKAGVFELMTGMDSTRVELRNIVKEREELEKMEVKTEKYIEKLNMKLLRSKDRLEAAKASEEKAKSMLPSFVVSLEELEKITKAAVEEKKGIIQEIEDTRGDIQKTESMTDSTEEKLLAAMQEMEEVRMAEAKALKKLKSLVESVVVDRASRNAENISISKFEYDYLTGCATGAEEIANKKVAAANAWANALRANAKEMEIRTAVLKREAKELKLKEEESSKIKVPVDKDHDKKSVQGRKSVTENSSSSIQARQAKFRKSIGSPAARRPIISTSLTLKRKRKVIRKIANYFVNKHTENENENENENEHENENENENENEKKDLLEEKL